MQNSNKVNNSFTLLTEENIQKHSWVCTYSLTIFRDFPKKISECLHFLIEWDLKSFNLTALKIKI